MIAGARCVLSNQKGQELILNSPGFSFPALMQVGAQYNDGCG